MELARIEQLVEAYFEGNTTLKEEQELRAFFATGEVPSHLSPLAPMFQGFEIAKEETFNKEIVLPEVAKKNNRFWAWGIAASFALLLGISSFFYFNNSGLTQEEQQALAAYEEARSTMMLLSENLNKGASKVGYLDEFSENAATIQYVNQFNETTSKYLK